jgi:hypothetical protein
MVFRFMDLPVELRLIVYDYLFASGYTWKERHLTTIHTPILRTCKSIYEEAKRALYGPRKFRIALRGRIAAVNDPNIESRVITRLRGDSIQTICAYGDFSLATLHISPHVRHIHQLVLDLDLGRYCVEGKS